MEVISRVYFIKYAHLFFRIEGREGWIGCCIGEDRVCDSTLIVVWCYSPNKLYNNYVLVCQINHLYCILHSRS